MQPNLNRLQLVLPLVRLWTKIHAAEPLPRARWAIVQLKAQSSLASQMGWLKGALGGSSCFQIIILGKINICNFLPFQLPLAPQDELQEPPRAHPEWTQHDLSPDKPPRVCLRCSKICMSGVHNFGAILVHCLFFEFFCHLIQPRQALVTCLGYPFTKSFLLASITIISPRQATSTHLVIVHSSRSFPPPLYLIQPKRVTSTCWGYSFHLYPSP